MIWFATAADWSFKNFHLTNSLDRLSDIVPSQLNFKLMSLPFLRDGKHEFIKWGSILLKWLISSTYRNPPIWRFPPEPIVKYWDKKKLPSETNFPKIPSGTSTTPSSNQSLCPGLLDALNNLGTSIRGNFLNDIGTRFKLATKVC